ncbi:glycosyltransferase family 2 protein [Ornithinimicrobium sp. W1679]|uniref:glycosyltransferase family 2 protein n=1 Tax=Ornithinimicrobium sp. W1679 TaxID=3418770 RepID=UPI003CEEF208
MGTVSVVIPTFNDDPAHLAEAVASVQAQTVPVEVVVVDDGSDVPVVLDGVRVIRQDNAGPSAARNAGIRATSGEFIYPLDADDRIEPGVIARLVEAMTEDVAIAYPVVDMFGLRAGRTPSLPETTLNDLVVFNRIVSAALFRRTDWEQVGGYVEGRGFPEDWVLWATILGRAGRRAVRVDEAVLHYRQRPGSLNATQSSPVGLVAARRQIARALPDRREDLVQAATDQALIWLSELEQARADASRWRRVESIWRPFVRVRRLLRS